MTLPHVLLAAIALLVAVIIALLVSSVRSHLRAKRMPAPNCDFPGCITARREMQALINTYSDCIPTRLLQDVLTKVQEHNHHKP